MLILTTSMLLSSTNTITAKTPDDTNPVTEKDKHHGDEGYPEPIQVTMDTTTGLLNVSFNTSLNDVTIALYKEDIIAQSQKFKAIALNINDKFRLKLT